MSLNTISKGFLGELVPQDSNDESTSVLLEQIKAKREAAEPKKKPIKNADGKRVEAPIIIHHQAYK